MKKIVVFMLALCLLLGGCSDWKKGSYASVKPHEEPFGQTDKPIAKVKNYAQQMQALATLVESGAESGALTMEYENEDDAQSDMAQAIEKIRQENPFAAYAVENIGYSFGTNNSKVARIKITYLPNRVRTDKIQRVQTLEQIKTIICQRLDDCDASVVLYFDNPEQIDFVQMVEDYVLAYPDRIMENPEVTVSLYPEQGQQQVVELKFTYQTSRVELRTYQNKVEPVFASALQYVTGEWTEEEKATRLYAFLMGRYQYSIQTSITPAYSLLLHGVGDGRAFAMVYAAMCREANLECRVVTGARNGTPWVWNAVQLNGVYYYLDLLRCNEDGGFHLYAQEEMTEYVWDYSAYPIAEEILEN